MKFSLRALFFYKALPLTAAIVCLSGQSYAYADAPQVNQGPMGQAFLKAEHQFSVPHQITMAVSYAETYWEMPDGVSDDNGYGPMHLLDGVTDSPLQEAMNATGLSKVDLTTNAEDNILGGAAVLRNDALKLSNTHTLPGSLTGWYTAVEEYSGATSDQVKKEYADSVFGYIRQGVKRTISTGETLVLSAESIPSTTAFAVVSPSTSCDTVDSDYSGACWVTASTNNYSSASWASNGVRSISGETPQNYKINYIVIHDAEGSYSGTIATFQNPSDGASAHYVVSDQGQITQMVHNKDVAWHAANWFMNEEAIGIEHEGYAANGYNYYSDAMYLASANLVRWLCQQYGIPMDRSHILGHDEMPFASYSYSQSDSQHWDPGPFWDWNKYMSLVQGNTAPTASNNKTIGVDMINPVTQNGTGYTTGFDYLFAPNGSLIGNGTTSPSDLTDKAAEGEQFVVHDSSNGWDHIWYNGQLVAVHESDGVVAGYGTVIETVAQNGQTQIPLYGQPTTATDTNYVICPTTYQSCPGPNQLYVSNVFYGADSTWYQIFYNHRIAWIPSSYVTIPPQYQINHF